MVRQDQYGLIRFEYNFQIKLCDFGLAEGILRFYKYIYIESISFATV